MYMKKNIRDVEKFWDDNPLFTGEYKMDNKKPDIFFQEHDLTYFKDVLSGIKIKKTFYLPKPKNYVLDLGCGIGFWSNLFVNKLKIKKIISADLSSQSLKKKMQKN